MLDDDDSILKIGSMSLEKIGKKEVTTFSSGQDFLKSIMDDPKQFDVILIDVNMPEIMGPEVVEKILEKINDFSTPILYLTGTNDKEEVRKLQEGPLIRGVIEKPFDPMKLANLISDTLK